MIVVVMLLVGSLVFDVQRRRRRRQVFACCGVAGCGIRVGVRIDGHAIIATAAGGGGGVSVDVGGREEADVGVAECVVHLHVLAQRGRMRVALVAAVDAAKVGLVGRVHVHVLLAVRAVGKAAIAALELALEWLLA